MSSEESSYFTKENLDTYLRELAKEYRKRSGRAAQAEIILIGGAAILANYGFRDMTTDVDAAIYAASSMKDAINSVGDRYGLPNGWLNADFMRTASYTPKLTQYSRYYKTFSNILTVRTVAAEYLIAMKLRSGRKYKHDLSDIIGILAEHEKHATPITADAIDAAIRNLYGGWDEIPVDSREFIQNAMQKGSYEKTFALIAAEERRTKDILVDFEQNYPGAATMETVDGIVKSLTAAQSSREAILAQLRKMEGQSDADSRASHKKQDRER